MSRPPRMAARREKTGGQEGLRSATFRSGRPENRRLRGVAFAAKLAKVAKIAKMAKEKRVSTPYSNNIIR